MEFTIHLQILGIVFITAVVMGAVANKTNFCTMGAVSDWVNMGDTGRLRGWFLAIAVATLGVALLEATGKAIVDTSTFPPYRTPNLAWLRYVLGGFMFGVGMTLASGCGNKTLVRIGGVKFDAAISEYIRRKYGLAIGERTSEDVKIQIGSAMYMPDKLTMEVKGRDMITGLPKLVEVTSDDVTTAIQHELDGIIATVKDVLNKTPPELSADVMDKGIMLSGGSSQLRNLDVLIAEATGVPTFVAGRRSVVGAQPYEVLEQLVLKEGSRA